MKRRLDYHSIAEDYKAGMTYKQMAKKYKCSEHSITNALVVTKSQMQKRRGPLPKETKAKIIERYKAGTKIETIAINCDTSMTSVENVLNKAAVKKIKRHTEFKVPNYNSIPEFKIGDKLKFHRTMQQGNKRNKKISGKVIGIKENFIILQLRNYKECFDFTDFKTGAYENLEVKRS
ncbi:hypothetical protein [Clostridium sp. DL1XJH146]